MTRSVRIALFALSAVALAATVTAPASRAAFPGAAGRIAYVEDGLIRSIKSDGSDIKQLTTSAQSPYGDSAPAWSPGGSMVAFERQTAGGAGEIWVMHADGTHQQRLTKNAADDVEPQWSPDGSRIVFASDRLGDYDIFTMDAAGGSVKPLTSDTVDERDPAWSPDGQTIAYAQVTESIDVGNGNTCNADIAFMNADGSGRHTVQECTAWVSPAASGCDLALSDPDWSADSRTLAIDEDCWGTPIIWDTTINDTLWGSSTWGRHGVAFDPSNAGAWPKSVFVINAETGSDLLIGYPGGGADTVIDRDVPGDRSDPDWQPIPAFPLVDARFSTFKGDIEWVYNEGITKGCTAERYCPADPVTREQMAIFLDRALKLPATATDYFSDDTGRTGEAAINRVAAAGITSGCASGKYCPTDKVTRGAMASFLARAFALPATANDYFTDDDGTTHEANINRVKAAGITSGCTPTTYCPTADVTRGQMAAFLRRALTK